MWSSIEQVIRPKDLTEAAILCRESNAAIFVGGSYLVSEKSPRIKTLIDVNHLLNSDIVSSNEGLLVGAACTLQQLLPHFQAPFATAIVSSCPSKNIRNQRTLGGELAEARVDSDLYILLLACQGELFLNGSDNSVKLCDWDGQGVITSVFIPAVHPVYERVALLDSARPFVLVAALVTESGTSAVVGGSVKDIVCKQFSNHPEASEVRDFLADVGGSFREDHFGSIEYKQQLVSSLLYELTVNK